MKRIVTIVGTRPEAIKMAPVHLALNRHPNVDARLLATAQHRQMLDQVMSVFQITADVDLDLMKENQTLVDLTTRTLAGVQSILSEMKPDAVLVHGDTTTCLASALAAFYTGIPIGHVEAGLRTYNFHAPWPEEMNRRLVDPISRWCFAPTEKAAENLRFERIPEENIFVTGNTVVDALLMARDRVRQCPPEVPGLDIGLLEGRRLVLVTGHRRESFGRPFEVFCHALRDLIRSRDDLILVYPVHLNPNVQKPVHSILGPENRIYLIEPLEYLPFVYLMDRSSLIITDSGGIQEEAPSLGKPVIVTRETTERPEAVDAGMAKLVGMHHDAIVNESLEFLESSEAFLKKVDMGNPYGSGHAAEQIADIVACTLVANT